MSAGGGGEYMTFVWQQLGQMQATLGRLEHASTQQTANIEKLETKLDETKEAVHGIKIRLAVWGATATLLAAGAIGIASVFGFVMKEVWDVAKPTVIQKLSGEQAPQVPQTPPQQAKKP